MDRRFQIGSPMFPTKKYALIYADPPWSFLTRSDKGKDRSAEQHYTCMSIEDICALPVKEIAADDCVLLMWVVDPLLEVGFEVIKAWGFSYKTVGFTWVKDNRKRPTAFMGMGYWTRANPEMCLLATRGSPSRLNRDVRQLVFSPIREHSRKPDKVYSRIERLCSGPYIELFARSHRPGWDAWGNEVTKFNLSC